MAIIGSLVARITADSKGYQKGMRKARHATKSFAHDVRGMAGKLAMFGGALAAVAGAGGMVELLKSSYENIDATAKLADRIGTTTEELGKLQYAAKITGSSSEDLNKGIQQMERTLGQARQGLSTYTRDIKLMGLNANKLAQMDPAKAFVKIGEAMRKLPSAADRATVAQDLFGRGGKTLINTLAQGKKGLDALGEAAIKTGVVFSRQGAAKAEAFNDSMTRLGAVITGVSQTLAIKLAPFLTVIANKLSSVAEKGGGVGKWVSSGFKTAAMAIAKVSDYVSLMTAGWKLFKAVAQMAIGDVIRGLGKIVSAGSWLASTKIGKILLGGDTSAMLKKTAKFMDLWADEMVKSANKAFHASGKAFDNFTSGAREKQVSKFFSKINSDADKAAKKIADKAKKAMDANRTAAQLDLNALASKSHKHASKPKHTSTGHRFEQVHIYNTVFGAGGMSHHKQQVESPQFAHANHLLDSILKRLTHGVPGIAT